MDGEISPVHRAVLVHCVLDPLHPSPARCRHRLAQAARSIWARPGLVACRRVHLANVATLYEVSSFEWAAVWVSGLAASWSPSSAALWRGPPAPERQRSRWWRETAWLHARTGSSVYLRLARVSADAPARRARESDVLRPGPLWTTGSKMASFRFGDEPSEWSVESPEQLKSLLPEVAHVPRPAASRRCGRDQFNSGRSSRAAVVRAEFWALVRAGDPWHTADGRRCVLPRPQPKALVQHPKSGPAFQCNHCSVPSLSRPGRRIRRQEPTCPRATCAQTARSTPFSEPPPIGCSVPSAA